MQKAPKADLQRTLAEQLESVPDLLKELQATKPDGQRLLVLPRSAVQMTRFRLWPVTSAPPKAAIC